MGHGQISFVSFSGVGTLGTIASWGVLCAIQKTSLNEPVSRCISMSKNVTLLTASGRITCIQYNANSKCTKKQCRLHRETSISPKTDQGRQRGVEGKIIRGNESRSMRKERSLGIARLALLEEVGFAINLLKGSRTRGRKPKRMNEAYPELQELFQKLVIEQAKPSA